VHSPADLFYSADRAGSVSVTTLRNTDWKVTVSASNNYFITKQKFSYQLLL